MGKSIELRPVYLSQALDVLTEFNILLNFSFWRKEDKDREAETFSSLNHAAFDLISERRYRLAARILEFGLGLKNTSVTNEVRLMMIVNHASAYRHLDDKDKSDKILAAEDWSASAPKFRIAVAALRGKTDDVVGLMKPAVAAGDLRKDDFVKWPVFSFIADDAKFREAFKDSFGEELPSRKDEVEAAAGDLAPPTQEDDTSGAASAPVATEH